MAIVNGNKRQGNKRQICEISTVRNFKLMNVNSVTNVMVTNVKSGKYQRWISSAQMLNSENVNDGIHHLQISM